MAEEQPPLELKEEMTDGEHGVRMIPKWPDRLTKAPSRVTAKLGTAAIRNVMDMNVFFGVFALALIGDPFWVMNVVSARKPSTLGVIFDRGLIGVYHDWCEPFSTYPRTYDLIHLSGIESLIKDSGAKKSRR